MAKIENTNCDSDFMDFDLDDLAEALTTNVKEDMKDFTDIINIDSCLHREVCLADICDGTGMAIAGYIDFWNRYDEKHNIPVEEREPIRLLVHSYGGSLIDTLIIIDAIKMSKTPVWGICTGAAYSGGFFALISCHKRFGYKHSSYLFHEGATQTGGTSSQFENYSVFYKKQLAQLKDIVLESTNITPDEYSDIKKDDIWYLAEEALEKGIIDVIVEKPEDFK